MTETPNECSIRPATAADLPDIVAMRDELNKLELAGCPHAPIQHLGLAEFTALWGHTLTSANHCWRVVVASGRVVGFGLVYLLTPRTEPPGAYLHWAFLKPGKRRRGVGERLLDHLLEWARSQGANRVELQFIAGNVAAESFWTKNGFQPYASKCVRYLTEDVINSSISE